jgi:hypothetical protein
MVREKGQEFVTAHQKGMLQQYRLWRPWYLANGDPFRDRRGKPRTPEEEKVLDTAARALGSEFEKIDPELILEQARALGDL